MSLRFAFFPEKTSISDFDFIIGYKGNNSLKITPSNLLGTVLPISGGEITGDLYVDGKLGLGVTSTTYKLHVDGTSIFTDQLTIPLTPVATTDAASKAYVDAQVTAADLDFTGDTGVGAVDLDSQTFDVTGVNGISTTASGTGLSIDGGTLQTAINTNTSDISTNAGNISTNTADIATNATNIATNTSDISTNASAISTNASNISTNTSNIASNTSDIATNTANISTNAASISTNSTNIATNTADISTNATNIATNTGNISANTTSISNNTAAISNNTTNIAANTTNIATNATDIATNATGISTNATGISTNATNIASNTTAIGTNTSNIATNAANIASNDTDISNLQSSVSTNTTNIATNASNIASNDSDISALQSSVATNTTNIATNTGNISTNTTNIATNTSNISANATNIATNTSNISGNTSAISTNTTNIATNASGISANASAISTNTTNISTNATNIASNDTDISNLQSDVSTNTSNIATNTSDIATKVGGTGTSGRVALWNGTNSLNSSSYLTYAAANGLNIGGSTSNLLTLDYPSGIGSSYMLFSTSGTSNARIYSDYTYDLKLQTYSTNGDIELGTTANTLLYLDNGTNRIGINDTTPSFSLDVNGSFRVTGTSSLGNVNLNSNLFVSSTSNIVFQGDYDDIYLTTNGDYYGQIICQTSADSNTIFVDGEYGTVGFGTATPTEKVHVNGNVKADKYVGQKMFISWYGYHSSTSLLTVYPTGMTTTYPYAYSPIVPTFNGEISTIRLRNNPYSSYTTGPTGSSITLYIYKNGSSYDSDTVAYTSGGAGKVAVFQFSGTTFSAGDIIELRVQANGFWRYCSWGIELKET